MRKGLGNCKEYLLSEDFQDEASFSLDQMIEQDDTENLIKEIDQVCSQGYSQCNSELFWYALMHLYVRHPDRDTEESESFLQFMKAYNDGVN